MSRLRFVEYLDKALLLLALVLFAWVGVRAILEVQELDSIAGKGRPLISELKVNAPLVEAEAPETESTFWQPPESQSRGPDWIFDAFTPPVIYYDQNSREFAVTPPGANSPDPIDNRWANFELELLEVRQRPYKLQLVGYAGEAGSYIAYFENTSSREIVLLREGQEEPVLGVRLLSFKEEQIETLREDSTPVVQSVGVARLADFASGQEISLTNRETKMYSELEAKLRLLPLGGIRFVETGVKLELENGDYLIEDLSAEPEAAMITKISKDGAKRFTRTLTPISSPNSVPATQRNSARPKNPFANSTNSTGASPSR